MKDKKLSRVAFDFYYASYDKLIEKEELGWTGWDNKCWKGTFLGDIKRLLKCELNQKNLVNIANYCMFLWNFEEEAKDGH